MTTLTPGGVMPLSQQTLDGLEKDYSRLREEAEEAGREFRRRQAEADMVAGLLRSNGRALLKSDDDADDVDYAPGPRDLQLRNAILRLIPVRAGGFKPSEMTLRLQRDGYPDDPTLPERVIRELASLRREGLIDQSPTDSRYRAKNAPGGPQQGEGEVRSAHQQPELERQREPEPERAIGISTHAWQARR